MEKKRYTVLFLPQDSGRVRSLTIPVVLLKGLVLFLVLSLGGISWVIYDYTRIRSEYDQLDALKRENIDQKIAIRSMASKLSDLEKELIKLKTFDRKLRVIANLDGGKEEEGNLLGVGGPGPGEGLSPDPRKEALEGLKEKLSLLEREVERQKVSFSELHGHLLDKKVLLASTPSIWPARGWVTSGYGYRISPFTGLRQFHQGIDIANRFGTPVVAPADGVVVKVGMDYSFGKHIVISHGYGITTRYGHLAKLLVKKGQKVKRGQIIGRMGNTGKSTGPHLHYEVVVNGRPKNPMMYILD